MGGRREQEEIQRKDRGEKGVFHSTKEKGGFQKKTKWVQKIDKDCSKRKRRGQKRKRCMGWVQTKTQRRWIQKKELEKKEGLNKEGGFKIKKRGGRGVEKGNKRGGRIKHEVR